MSPTHRTLSTSGVAVVAARIESVAAFVALPDTLTAVVPFNSTGLEAALRSLAEAHGVKAAALIHATRVAVTGRAVSPGLFDVLELMGAETVRDRVRHALNFLPK